MTEKYRSLMRMLAAGCAILAVGGWLWRVIWLNAHTPFPERVVYAMGEKVPYDDDFFLSSREQRGEYSLTVKSAAVLPLREYAAIHQLTLSERNSYGPIFWPDNVLEVIVEVERAEGFDEREASGGIDLFQTLLTTHNLRLPIKWELFDQLYPQLQEQKGFQLQPGTSMEFRLPFTPETAEDQTVADEEYLKTKTFYLNLTLYPHKKQVEVRAHADGN